MEEREGRRSGARIIVVIIIMLAFVLPVNSGFSTIAGTYESFNEAYRSGNINIMHAGIEFDSQIGEPTLPANMKAANSDRYIVQFKGPVMPAWKQELKDQGAKVHQYVEDNAYVVEMNDRARSDIEELANVGWIGPYHPAYKVDWTLNDKVGETELAVFAFDDAFALANKLKNIGTVVDIEEEFGKVYLTTDASNIPIVAQLSDVNYIFFQPEYQTLNNRAGEIDDCHTLWEVEKSGLPIRITGLGIRLGLADTGWDNGNTANGHWDFTRGPLGARVAVAEGDTDGHGTRCAGVMLGNGYCMEVHLGLDSMNQNYYEQAVSNPIPEILDLEGYTGSAPEATLEAHQPLGTSDWNTMSANGCVAICNAWGTTGTPTADYNADCQSADTLMDANPIIIIPFACGNSGPGPRTISGGGNSWNGLSVTATENFRPEIDAISDDPNQVYESTSRGPMTSGRIKPDISIPGTNVISTSPDYLEIEPLIKDYVDVYNPANHAPDYTIMSGTSVSCARATGQIGLIHQYLRDIEGIPSPNRVVTKAILLNGAVDTGYGYPSYQNGWGRANVKNSLCPDAPRTNQWAEGSLTTGQTWDFVIDGGANTYIESDRVPLKVMVCWDMPAGSAMSNDYELEVTSPSGVVYKGNCFDQVGDNDDWSHPDPDAAFWNTLGSPTAAPYGFDYDTDGDNDDDINNVEAVFVEKPEVGQWTVVVRSDSTPDAPNFAVAWGADTGTIDPYLVEMSTDQATTLRSSQGGTLAFPFEILNFGTNLDNIQFSDDSGADLTITYSEISPLALALNTECDIIAQISVSPAAAIGTHEFTITAISLDDPGSPATQDHIDVKVDVIDSGIPFTYKVTANDMSQSGPSVVAFTDFGGTDHVIVAYASEEGIINGNRVFMKHTTSDLTAGGAATWTKAQVSTLPDEPKDIRISHMPSGTYQDRVFISWKGWNPSDFTDYGGNWAYCAWADPPYTTWNPVQVYSNADNPTYDDVWRMTMTACRGSANEVMMIVETLEYSGGVMQAVDTFGKLSTNGGVTWSAIQQISPGDGNYYFFPNAFTDHNDNIVVYYYWRTPAGTDRDLCYNYWDGSWQPAGGYYMIFDNLENTMFPAGTSTLEGPGDTNRLYVFHTRGTTSDSPKDGYILWADTAGGYPTVEADWNGPFAIHPDVAGSTISDSDYPNRAMLDVDATFEGGTWYVWPQYLEQQEDYNPYGVFNVHNTVSNDGFATMKQLNKITADSYVKNHQAGDSLGAYMYETYNSYSNDLENGNMDIWLKVYHYDWINDPDIYGPETSMVAGSPNPAGQGWIIDVHANVDDISSGFSNIAAAEWCEGVVPSWPGTAMGAMDGAFDNVTEAVTAVADTAGWAYGYHTLWVRGQDEWGNWGEPSYGVVEIVDMNAPPDVTVTYPTAPVIIESGTITIAWEATDYEDLPEDLYITINYSLDNGGYWYGITDGYLNTPAGTGSYVWDSTAVADGVNYMIKVTAVDTVGKSGFDVSDNPFSIDNVPIFPSPNPEAEWFFQVDGPFELNMKPVELTPNTVQSAGMTTTGPYLIGAWETTEIFFSSVAIDGLWEFDIYGYTENPGIFEGYLYAVVKDGLGTIVDTTIWDDVNVGAYTSSNMFTWNDTLIGITTPSQTIIVEIWLDVTVGDGGSEVLTYVPNDPEFTAEYCEVDAMPPTFLIEYPITEADVSVSDDVRFSTIDPGVGDKIFTWCEVTVSADPATITQIDMTFEGQGNQATDFNLWLLSDSGGWAATGDTIACFADTDGTLTGTIAANFADYIIGSVLTWGVYQTDESDLIRIDFLETVVNYDIPAPVFYMEYDYGDTQSSVSPTLNFGPPSPYDVPVTIGWNFMSYPVTASGPVTSVFDDNGGDTTWDIIYWYDPTDIEDHWKSYNKNYPGTQDMPDVNNEMGFWVNITDAGSDGFLTFLGNAPVGTVITLAPGWNMVGFPSTAEGYTAGDLKTDSGGIVTRIEWYNDAAAYDIEPMPDGANFLIGQAYWISATVAYPWIIP